MSIETPEGPNIGLISSLCVHARINDFGFIETPYRVVKNGKVSKKIQYLTAEEEDHAIIAQANAPIDSKGNYENKYVKCRHRGDFPIVDPTMFSSWTSRRTRSYRRRRVDSVPGA